MVKFKRPTQELLELVAADMRDADKVEIWASDRQTPLSALTMGVSMSDYSTAVVIDDTPCAVMGLSIRCPLTGSGVPWLLGANAIMRYKREILLQSPRVIDQMLTICPRLFNFVHCENKASIRWLRWLGFTIESPKPYGVGGELFHKFHLERVH